MDAQSLIPAHDEFGGHRDAGHTDLGAARKQSRIGQDPGAADGCLDSGRVEEPQELPGLRDALAPDAGAQADDDLGVLEPDTLLLLRRHEIADETQVASLDFQHL